MRSLPVMLKAAGQAELPAALTACKQHPSAGVRQAAHAFMLALNLLPARPAVQPAQVLGVPARADVAATGAASGALKQEGQEALELDWAKLPPEAVRCSTEMAGLILRLYLYVADARCFMSTSADDRRMSNRFPLVCRQRSCVPTWTL
jgi:hypothetical protein